MPGPGIITDLEMEKLLEHLDALFRDLADLLQATRKSTDRHDVWELVDRVSADLRHLHRERAVERLLMELKHLRTRVERLEGSPTRTL